MQALDLQINGGDTEAAGMKQTKRTFLYAAAAMAASLGLAVGPRPSEAQVNDVIVFAAASLKNAVDAIGAEWQKETGKKVRISYGASPALAKQIEQDAPSQIFISADRDWMDYLEQRGHIRRESRVNLLGNRIVLVMPKSRVQVVDIKPGFDLARTLGDGRLAMANVDAVPAGKYGKAALETLGVWASVVGKLAQTENVRAALLLVSRGEAAAGIVYQTDAAADLSVTIIGTFPEDTHPAIVYPMALTSKATSLDAAAFLAYLQGSKSKTLFEAQGFKFLIQKDSN